MRAVVQHGYGAPMDVLQLADVEVPTVAEPDVLVSVRLFRPTRGLALHPRRA